jgi:hypothetical protein
MSEITLIMLFIILVAFSILSYFHIKKVKTMIGRIKNGKIQDKQLSRFMIKAKASSKCKFIVYAWLKTSLIHVFIATIVVLAMDFFIGQNELELIRSLIVFLFIFAIITFIGVVSANSIWNLSQ